MWFHIYKMSLMQQSRRLKKYDYNVWIIVAAVLIGFQFYIFRELDETFQQIAQLQTELILTRIMTILGFFFLTATLFFLYTIHTDVQVFLLRLPIPQQQIFRANTYPFLGMLLLIFLVESGSFLFSFLRNIETLLHPVWFVLLYLCFVGIHVLLAFIQKFATAAILSRLRLHKPYVEVVVSLLFLAAYLVAFLFIPTLTAFHPATWLELAAFGNWLYAGYIVALCLGQFALVHNGLSRISLETDAHREVRRSITFHPSMMYNGLKLELLLYTREWKYFRTILFSLSLGVFFVYISYELFGSQNQAEHFDFLLLPIGLALTTHSLYSKRNVSMLRNLPVRTKELLIGKHIFYVLAAVVMLGTSLLVLSGLQVDFNGVSPLYLTFQLVFLVEIALVIHLLFAKSGNENKMLSTIVSFIAYFGFTTLVKQLTGMLIVQLLLFVAIAFLSAVLFVIVYRKKLELA